MLKKNLCVFINKNNRIILEGERLAKGVKEVSKATVKVLA